MLLNIRKKDKNIKKKALQRMDTEKKKKDFLITEKRQKE